MTTYFWSSIAQLVVLLLIIAAAFVLPEPKYIHYPCVSKWTPEISFAQWNNKLIYTRRMIRRGVGVGLLFGLIAAAVTWLVNGF